ncbi:MAG: S-layer protein [Nanoarchaeota archaeon]|nr:S-layer protein [Nanoarchaeota archaeon]MBU1322410.1 S-layer protein [Nanoarchaeota archaeon]MBU1598159.1 S-layer protein [Nanoarchaeota archaeon]MBU2441434.1 S-layer protein [Nanoarchaeota archaeon]
MDIRKTVKKIAALVAGTTMLGATIMGAAADLGNYPAPFVANGVFDGKIVVGANAATSDVVGAIDLAASLQAAASVTSEVEVPGVAGTTTVTGDSAEFKTGSDIPYLGEALGSVKTTFTDADLDGLSSGVFTSGSSTTPVKQYLKFENSGLSIAYEQDSNTDVSADFMKIASDAIFFEYHMEFTEGAVSEVTSSVDLLDFESEVLNIMGIPYTIVDAKISGVKLTLDLMGGEVADTLRDGETKTYTIDGKEYEVTAVFIDSTDQKAKLSVNGMLTKELAEGRTELLGSDVTVGVQEILTNQREGLVEFYLGANKVELQDTDYADTTYAAGVVKVGGNRIDNAFLILKATNESGDIKLNYIKYKLTADDELWVPAGEGLKAYLTEPEGLLGDNWDIFYAGLTNPGMSTIKFDPVSSHSYDLKFTNLNGDEYTIPLVTDKTDAHKGWAYGDNDDDFIFTEPYTVNITQGLANETWISDDDYFIVRDRAASDTDDKAVVNVLRYKSLSTGDSTVTFDDIAGGTIVVSYINTTGVVTGELIVAGASHNFWVYDESTADATEKYSLAMDLDASGAIDSAEVQAVAKGGAIIDFGTQTFNYTAGTANNTEPLGFAYTGMNVTVTTIASNFDESVDGPEVIKVTLSNTTTANQLAGTVNGTMYEKLDDDKYEHRMTRYGATIEKYTPTSSSSIEEIMIEYPLVQRYGQVFVTMGSITAVSGGGDGSVMTTNINPIAVGLAVLDTDAPALGSENLIVVGGPCANTVAAELMGNPENCAEGFEPGKAIIKLFAAKNALLVAGYEAQETLGACYVMADYEDYDLSGTEVEVIVADLNTITVNTVV